jgi:hypothetical protein
MLAAIARLAQERGVDYIASVEARMACALGVCLSCSLPLVNGRNFKTCQDGPMVEGTALDWEKLHE